MIIILNNNNKTELTNQIINNLNLVNKKKNTNLLIIVLHLPSLYKYEYSNYPSQPNPSLFKSPLPA